MSPLPPLLLRGDCLAQLQRIPTASVDAVVCDPPYGLDFMGKEWDNAGKLAARMLGQITPGDNSKGPLAHGGTHSRGYADHNGLAFELWVTAWAAECLRVLKPGGHLLAFGGSRTWHRLAAGIEDAGFELRDSIAWLYGSGFSKGLDVSKAIDKAGGASPVDSARVLKAARLRSGLSQRQVADALGCSRASVSNWEDGRSRAAGRAVEYITPGPPYRDKLADLLGYTADERAIVDAADDRRGDGTVLGLGYSGVEYGAPATDAAREWAGWGTALKPAFEPVVVARKPLVGTVAANVLAHGTGALNIDATRIEGGSTMRRNRAEMGYHGGNLADEYVTGSEAGRWPANVVLDESQAAALDAQSGTSKSRQSATVKPMKRQDNEVYGKGLGSVGPENTHADEGGASRFYYVAKAPKSERPVVEGVAHPTVKPLALMRWLCRLVTPPGGCIVDPFAGSGTTLEAAYLEGFESIGIELTPDYWPLIAARIDRAVRAVPHSAALVGDRPDGAPSSAAPGGES